MILVAAFLASMIPAAIMFIWLRKQKDMPEGFDKTCDKALLRGVLTVFPVVLCSAVLHLLAVVTGLRHANPFVFQAYYTFFVLAFAEELCKFLAMRKIVRSGSYSWLSVVIIMVLVGLGFEVIEAIPYAIGAGPGPMFMRGFTLMHAAFGFIMGYFYGKFLRTGNKMYFVTGFIVPWLMHGFYDYCLSDVMLAIEWPGFAALFLAFFSVILLIIFVRFVIKAKKNEKYMAIITQPVAKDAAQNAEEEPQNAEAAQAAEAEPQNAEAVQATEAEPQNADVKTDQQSAETDKQI